MTIAELSANFHTRDQGSARRDWHRVLLVLLINIGLRVAYSVTHPTALTDDADGYLAHARMLADGQGYVGPSTGKPTAFRSPGYPFALAVTMSLGFGPAASVAVINMLSTMLILWLIRLLGRQLELSSMAILAAQLGAAMDPMMIRYTVAPMTEIECAAILLGAIVVLRQSLQPTLSPWQRSQRCLIAGFLFGLGTFVRPVVAICCAMVTVWVMWRVMRERPEAGSTGRLTSQRAGTLQITTAFLTPLAALLVLLPWIIRNELVFGRFIPATTHGGYTLALGNNPDFYRDVINGKDQFPWDGAGLDAWQQRMIAEMQRAGIARADEPAEDAWYYRTALTAMRADPSSCAKATLLRLRRFWALTVADDSVPVPLRMLIGCWYTVILFGVLLSVIGCRWRSKSEQSGAAIRGTGMLWAVVTSFVLMHAFYWTDTRMRAPIMPILIVLSVIGWNSLATRLRRPKQA